MKKTRRLEDYLFARFSLARSLANALIVLGLLLTSSVYASEIVEVTEVDTMDVGAVVVSESSGTAQFAVHESITGISTTYQINLDSQTWVSWDSAGNVFSGQLPPNSSTEWVIPCFAGPWAFAGCVGGGILGGWFCSRRDASFASRAVSVCGEGGVASLDTGYCGLGASFSCVPPGAHLP